MGFKRRLDVNNLSETFRDNNCVLRHHIARMKLTAHNEMKLKQNSFKAVLKLFCFSFTSVCGQFNCKLTVTMCLEPPFNPVADHGAVCRRYKWRHFEAFQHQAFHTPKPQHEIVRQATSETHVLFYPGCWQLVFISHSMFSLTLCTTPLLLPCISNRRLKPTQQTMTKQQLRLLECFCK